MTELGLEKIPVEDLILLYLENIGKKAEYNRILNSRWTKIENNKLLSLDLSRLEIIELDKTLFNNSALSELKFLYLQGNKIELLAEEVFEKLNNLIGINLPNNQISRIYSFTFQYLHNLEWLNLSSNSIEMIEPGAFDGLENLISLNLSHNQIHDLELVDFSALTKLTKLNLFNNRLKVINPEDFEGLVNLTELNLQANKIIQIDNGLPTYLPELGELYLKHNPAFTSVHTFKSRYDIIEMFRARETQLPKDIAMTELLNFEDDQIIATFNQLIDDPRWDGGIGRVSNYKLSKVIGIPIEMIARKIESLITQKKLRHIIHHDNNDPMAYEKHYWIRSFQEKGSINTGINEPKCLWCNEKLIDTFDRCPNCGLRCEICKFSIKQTQEFDVCTAETDQACLDIFHRSEFLEWVRIYGSCPQCSQEINLNFYQVSQDYSKKVGALVEQNMVLDQREDNKQNSEFLVPLAMSILINLKKVKSNVETSEELIKDIGKEARDHHQQLLEELQPLATELVLITAFLDRLESNNLTEKSFKASIAKISERFDIFEENIDIIYESHKKDNEKLEKIKKLTGKAGLKGGEIGVKALVERSGLMSKIKDYVRIPTKEGLKSILNRIGQGIKDKTGDPTAWIKLGAVFLI